MILSEFEKRLLGVIDETKQRREEFANFLAYTFDVLGVVSFDLYGLPVTVDLRKHKHKIKEKIATVGDREITAIWDAMPDKKAK